MRNPQKQTTAKTTQIADSSFDTIYTQKQRRTYINIFKRYNYAIAAAAVARAVNVFHGCCYSRERARAHHTTPHTRSISMCARYIASIERRETTRAQSQRLGRKIMCLLIAMRAESVHDVYEHCARPVKRSIPSCAAIVSMCVCV